jgi:8-oxo-dGTP diphosphatase
VTVDVVLLTVHAGRLSVLLVERDTHPYRGALALPGGFVRPEEDLEAAAVRRLERETGVRRDAAHVEQLGAYGDPRRDPRMRVVSVAYLVFAPDLPPPVPGRGTRSVAWVPVAEVDEPRLAFDHEQGARGGRRAGAGQAGVHPPGSGLRRRALHGGRAAPRLRGGVGDRARPAQLPPQGHRHARLPGAGRPAGAGGAGGRPAGGAVPARHATSLHPAMLRPTR